MIPPGATKPKDIPVTLIYCNKRTTCEDIADQLRGWASREEIDTNCIAFYHAQISEKRKRELEEKLRKGEVRILVCTDAVGMVSMTHIVRGVLNGYSPNCHNRDVICVT